VGRDADKQTENPLKVIDKILSDEPPEKRVAMVVNLHGDFSSEKLVIGYYLDGRVSIVVGDHWHVPTADADVLPKGTARMTDVGMCGSLDSSLGVTFDSVIPRWRDDYQTRNQLETAGRSQFNGLLVDVDEATGKARSAEHIRTVW
jgi:calcineurin-like phosphoesterase